MRYPPGSILYVKGVADLKINVWRKTFEEVTELAKKYRVKDTGAVTYLIIPSKANKD